MAQLNEKELALLSTLIYLDVMVNSKFAGDKVSEVVDDLLKTINDTSLTDEKKLEEIGNYSGDFGYFKEKHSKELTDDQAVLEKLKEVLMQVKGTKLMDLTIVSQKPNDGTTSAIAAACFVDDEGAATVAFRGTDASYKAWYDNFEGAGATIATPMQEAAQKYIDSLEYDNITVTGHSKGGNLAAFVTVLCDNVANGVSFDGQGFSENFHLMYHDRIAERQEKIKTISAHKDKVNSLLLSIGKKFYVKTDGTGVETSHLMTNLLFQGEFDNDGNYTNFVDQAAGTKLFNIVVDILVFALPAPVEEWLTDTLGVFGAGFMSKWKLKDGDWLHMFGNIIIGILSAVVVKIFFVAITPILVAVAQSLMTFIMTTFGALCTSISAAVSTILPLLNIALPILAWIAYRITYALASKVPEFAQGGFPVQGQMFVAREAGPELVGSLNGRTAVVNRDQIIEAVSGGVYSAFNLALRDNHAKEPSVARVFLDGRLLTIAGARSN